MVEKEIDPVLLTLQRANATMKKAEKRIAIGRSECAPLLKDCASLAE